MFKYLGRFAAAHPWLICLAWLLVASVVGLVAPRWDDRAEDDDIRFLPARCDSVRGYHLLEQAFPQDVFASRLIFAVERADTPLTAADLALVDGLAADLQRLRQDEPSLQIARICTAPRSVPRQASPQRRRPMHADSGVAGHAVPGRADADHGGRGRAAASVIVSPTAGKAAPAVHVTGPAGIGRDLIAASADSLDSTTLATVILVVVILLLVYRAPLLALVPLVTIAVSVWVALKILAL